MEYSDNHYTPFTRCRLVKLDSRYNYFNYFEYAFEYHGISQVKPFIHDRLYMTKVYGDSVEAHLYASIQIRRRSQLWESETLGLLTNCWSWSLMGKDSYDFRIYIVDSILLSELRLSGAV